jgi:hypothetical protein
MSTIWRFITVRNPRKPTKQEVATGFMTYDPSLAAPLMTAVIQAGQQEASPRQVRELIEAFRRSASFIRDPEQIDEWVPDLVAWADWLATQADRLTRAKLDARLAAQPIEIEPPAEAWLWDNLLALTYGGGRPEVRESVIGSLRVANLLRFPKDEITDNVARRLAAATVLIPAEAHIAAQPRLEEPEGGGSPVYAATALSPRRMAAPEPLPQRTAAPERMAALQAAHDELASYYRSEIELARAADVQPPVLPQVKDGLIKIPRARAAARTRTRAAGRPEDVAVLDDSVGRRLSPETRRVFDELGIVSGSRIPYVLETIERAAAEEGRAAGENAPAVTRVVHAGGAFWTYEPQAVTHGHAVMATSPRVDLEYVGIQGRDECRIRPLGVGDFRRVEQKLWCYEPGEVAHIENILRGEAKERGTRRLRRTEEILTVVTEVEKTEERDTQTTDRFELERETSKEVESELSFELGVQIAASYGPVKIQADTKFATSTSTTESDKTASRYAREITDRALQRVVTKTREERTTRLIEEFEETNKHVLDNVGGAEHIVGLYRWVNKVYQAKIVNYGKRLMVEFMIPEPGAFHLHAMTESPIEGSLTVQKPIDPRSDEAGTAFGRPPLRTHTEVSPGNYAFWAAAYDASVEPVPPRFITVSKSYHRDAMDHNVQFADSKNDFKVPDGYEAQWFHVSYGLHSEFHDGGPNWITIFIGQRSNPMITAGSAFSGVLAGEDDFVPITVMGRTRFYALAVEVDCERKPGTYEAWQIKTFGAILKGYQDRLSAYLNALAEAQARAGVQIQGTNPASNRDIEKMELKKGAIRLMTQCAAGGSEAMKANQQCGYPEFECCEAIRDGSFVQFVEQAFEWSLITYLFYPYFWGRKCNWKNIYTMQDVDPLFLAFLQAGYARVVVPVRENYDDAVLRFLADGTPWNGGSAPGVDSEMYVAIANEMKEPVGKVDPTVEPWEIRVPTQLTALQCESGCVEGRGLPCPRGTEND